MSSEREGEVRINSEGDIIAARKTVRSAATQLGFGITDVTRIVTAASELTRNIYSYAGSGVLRWRALDSSGRIGIELTFADNGPGIPDIEQAMETGYTTSGGLGMGLPGAKRLMDDMDIHSAVGSGTTVTVRKWQRKP
jgi:serine/threonine-protein kinase RsbT